MAITTNIKLTRYITNDESNEVEKDDKVVLVTGHGNELAATIFGMVSDDYKKRMSAEYVQARIRAKRLKNMLDKYEKGELEFTPNTPIEVLKKQLSIMVDYIKVLEDRANIEGVEIIELINGVPKDAV